MPAFSSRVRISAAPEAVYALVSDVLGHGRWSADALEITADAEGGFRSTSRSKGKVIDARLKVVEQAAPSRFVFDVKDLTGRWRHTFTLTASGSGTKVKRRVSGKLSLGQALLYWVVLLPIKKPNGARALRKLKALAEGRLATSPRTRARASRGRR